MPIIRKRLSEAEAVDPCNCPEKTFQVNDAGQILESTDGGQTYHLSSDDPRNDIAEQPTPPIDSGYTKCDAAQNVVNRMQDNMQKYANSLDRGQTLTQLAGIILGIIFAFLELTLIGALLTPLLIAIAAALIGMNADDFRAYFTNEVWDAVLCAVVCAMGDDARLTDDEFVRLINSLRSRVPAGIGKGVLIDSFRLAGRAEVNNYAHTGTSSGFSCSCDCPCADNFSAVVGSRLDTPYYTDYASFKSSFVPGIGQQVQIQTANTNACCKILDMKFDLVGETGGGFTPFSGNQWTCGTDWNVDPGFNPSPNLCTSKIKYQVHPIINPNDQFVMSVLFAECD